MITPILKDPKLHGGTLYTFPSASRDLTRSFTNSEYEFAFSHFACLNLPDFRYGKFEDGAPKGVYLDSIYENCIKSCVDNSNNIDLNNALKWHLQSYVMNFEIAILNELSSNSKYNSEILRTPSERIFFNWLQKVGAIKFNNNKVRVSETLEDYGYSSVSTSNTVQYIGTIDMINNVNINFDSFNEIYLNIPSVVGCSTNVYFNNNFDDNYTYKHDINGYIDESYKDYIIGRGETGVSDNTLKAIYDNDYKYIIDSGYCINFNDSEYGSGIDNMNLKSEYNFEFNCVLIYYRIRKGNGDWVTNLYGVLFLEEVIFSDDIITKDLDASDISFEENDILGYIQRYPKFKNGNSWGLKIDLKIDTQPDSQLELRYNQYDDPNEGGSGMQMFSEALIQLSECTKLFYDVKKENTYIEERLYKLENIVSDIDTVLDLKNDVSELKMNVEMFQPTLNSLEGRVDSIESKIKNLETNLGYLISDIKSLTSDLKGRLSTLENSTNDLNDRVSTLENKDYVGENSDSDSDL